MPENKKRAILIGVSQYGAGLPSLAGAANDVAAMQRVLEAHDFEVETLPNPDPTAMRLAISQLFERSQKGDIALLYFSGHGLTDDDGRLYLTTCMTDKSAYRATSVPASFLHNEMNFSRCKRQVVILDCCYGGAFAEGWQPKGTGVDIERELGGEGRAVLTSSSAVQLSFEQEGTGIYTRFLVEGLETGAADRDGSGTISIQELHEYAKQKVQAAKPSMKPEIYLHKEGFNIVLTQVSVNDPQLNYRREVEQWVKLGKGEISSIGRRGLRRSVRQLGIVSEVAQRIEKEVLAPYQEHKENIKEYEEAYAEALELENPLSEVTFNQLKYLQQSLGLTDEDVSEIEERLRSQGEARQRQPAEKPAPKPAIRQSGQFSHSTSAKSNVEADDLSSEVGVDYSNLQKLLAEGKWREADKETADKMLAVMGKEYWRDVEIEDIEKFPCTDLRTIDRLWVKYSNGRFGFSVQKRIWESLGGKPGEYDYEIYLKFCDRVEWKVKGNWKGYGELTFDIKAPEGHLPGGVGWGGSPGLRGGFLVPAGVVVGGFSSLASALVNCNI